MDEVGPMTEDEAEEALLALGGVLEWSPKAIVSYIGTANGTIHLHQCSAQTPESRYSIYEQQQPSGQRELGWRVSFSSRTASGADDLSVCPLIFPNELAVKIACERHHTTGQWESKHSEQVPG